MQEINIKNDRYQRSKTLLHKLAFNPENMYYTLWRFLLVFLALVEFFVFPFIGTFGIEDEYEISILIGASTSTILFLIDCILNFFKQTRLDDSQQLLDPQ